MHGRWGLFLKAVGLLTVACTAVTAAVCAISYGLSRDRRPTVFMSAEATEYARQALFADARQMAAFTARLQAVAEETGTSVAVTYIERPRQGQTLAAAMQEAVEGLQARLDGSFRDYERSMLVIVLMGKPRIFGFVGSDHARTRVYLRNLSGDPAVHSLNFKHIQVTHGLYLMQSLSIAREALRPLHAFVEHNPAHWLLIEVLELVTGMVPERPNETAVRAIRAPLGRLAGDYGVPPIALLLGVLIIAASVIKAFEHLTGKLQEGVVKTALWAFWRWVPVPVAGTVAVVMYGSLENIASLAQMSGQSVLELVQWSRTLPAPTIPTWVTWLVLPASYVIALGVTLGIGLKVAGGDAHLLIAPHRWFSGHWLPLRLLLRVTALALVLLLPVPFMVALASMEGLMSVALPVTMLITWTDDVWRFWRALGAPGEGAAQAPASLTASRPRAPPRAFR
jgi:hypothetical protein